MDQATVDEGGTVMVSHDRAVALIDELRRQEQLLGAVQARRAALMVEFGDVRRGLDQRVIGDRAAEGGSPRYRAGEFAVTEISLAVTASKFGVGRVVGMARRLRAEAPDVWDSWCAGEIDHDKAVRINRALRRLMRDDSKQLLNTLVVSVAPLKTPELLGRWLNQFIAQVEPDETDERLRRAFEDRYVSVRPDIDGISFLHAALSCVDAAAVDQLLSALAGAAGPGDDRTFAQRRADALVDVLCGRVSNGCHGSDPGFDVNTDTDDHLDDPAPPSGYAENPVEPVDDVNRDGPVNDIDRAGAVDDAEPARPGTSGDATAPGEYFNEAAEPTDGEDRAGAVDDEGPVGSDVSDGSPAPGGHRDDLAEGGEPPDPDSGWEEADFDRPASAFRPGDGTGRGGTGPDGTGGDLRDPEGDDESAPYPFPDAADSQLDGESVDGRPLDTEQQAARGVPSGAGHKGVGPGSVAGAGPLPCTCQHKPLPVTIGIIVTASALFGYTNTPGQLADRSSLIPADLIRDLAAQPGTLFHRLITDDAGNLLEVTELGRFPSRKLGLAVRYRDPVCVTPTCHTPARRCDIDHLTPAPEGPTSGANLKPECRCEHRAKTHGGHHITRTGPHSTEWTTPTGHRYSSDDPPLPVDSWPVTTGLTGTGPKAPAGADTGAPAAAGSGSPGPAWPGPVSPRPDHAEPEPAEPDPAEPDRAEPDRAAGSAAEKIRPG